MPLRVLESSFENMNKLKDFFIWGEKKRKYCISYLDYGERQKQNSYIDVKLERYFTFIKCHRKQ